MCNAYIMSRSALQEQKQPGLRFFECQMRQIAISTLLSRALVSSPLPCLLSCPVRQVVAVLSCQAAATVPAVSSVTADQLRDLSVSRTADHCWLVAKCQSGGGA